MELVGIRITIDNLEIITQEAKLKMNMVEPAWTVWQSRPIPNITESAKDTIVVYGNGELPLEVIISYDATKSPGTF